VGIVATICAQLVVFALLKSNDVSSIAFIKVIQASVGGTVQTVGMVMSSANFLVIGHLVGLLTFAPLFWGKLLQLSFSRWHSLRRATIASAIKFRRYPAYVAPSELIDAASHQVPLLLIGWTFSLATLGQYAFAQRMLAGPAALIGQSVGQVFFKSISSEQIELVNVYRLILRVWLYMALLGSVPFCLIFIYGAPIFVLFFGGEWLQAGQFAEALAVLLFVRFVSSPTSTIYYRLNLQRAQFLITIAALIVRTAPFLMTIQGATFIELIWLCVVGEIVLIIGYNLVAIVRIKGLRDLEMQQLKL